MRCSLLTTPGWTRQEQTTGDNCHVVRREGEKARNSVLLYLSENTAATVGFAVRLSNKADKSTCNATEKYM